MEEISGNFANSEDGLLKTGDRSQTKRMTDFPVFCKLCYSYSVLRSLFFVLLGRVSYFLQESYLFFYPLLTSNVSIHLW